MKYVASTIKDRVELIVREELNQPDTGIQFDTFLEQFIYHVSDRLTELIQNEIKYHRERF